MPVFALPLALFALSALPLLAAVYFLSSRHQKRVVSSLLLWPKDALPKGGGRKASRFRAPWLLLLEILILVLLALAAAAPMLGLAAGRRPVCVVLDDRVSLRAHDASGASSRARGLAALLAELEKAGKWEAFVVIAGPRPLSVGSAQTPEALKELIGAASSQSKWPCLAESSDVSAALSLAGQTAPPGAVSLVVSDRAPPKDLAQGVRWLSVGALLPNLGITAAARGRADDGLARDDRVMVELSNFSAAPVKAQVVVERADGAASFVKVSEAAVPIAADGRETAVFKAPPESTLRVRLAVPDALDEDNAVTLLPEPRRILKAKVEVGDETLRQAVSRALLAAGAEEVSSGEALLVSDAPVPLMPAAPGADPKAKVAAPLPQTPQADVWEWRIAVSGKEDQPKAYTGPFILQRGHALTRGLLLDGVVWGAPPAGVAAQTDDEEVVGLGDRPLLVDRLFPGGEHRLFMALAPDLSTLAETPAFPVLIANLADWRLAHEPGLRRANWRQGESVRVAVAPLAPGPWRLEAPGAAPTQWRGGPVFEIPTARTGAHRFMSADGKWAWPFQVNLCNAEASDLRLAVSAAAGQWSDAVKTEGRFKPAFLLILVALGLLMLHAWLVRRGAAASGSEGGFQA